MLVVVAALMLVGVSVSFHAAAVIVVVGAIAAGIAARAADERR